MPQDPRRGHQEAVRRGRVWAEQTTIRGRIPPVRQQYDSGRGPEDPEGQAAAAATQERCPATAAEPVQDPGAAEQDERPHPEAGDRGRGGGDTRGRGPGPGPDVDVRQPEGGAGRTDEEPRQVALVGRGGPGEADGGVRGVWRVFDCRRCTATDRGSFDGETAFRVRIRIKFT